MGVFHVFDIKQMVPNRVMHHKYAIKHLVIKLYDVLDAIPLTRTKTC